MRHNPRLLFAISALGAVGFVALRVVYRIVFGGASSGEIDLPSLAPIRLAGPFSHIVLFGPVTLEGLGQAALSALPFALVIVLTGVVVALWDPRNLIVHAPRLRRGGSLVLAVGIAVAMFPVVIDSFAKARASFQLRGVKPGVKAFQPLLEKTLERALGIATALVSRGIASTPVKSDTVSATGNIELSSWAIPSRGFGPVTASFASGTAVLLTGATGSGKTTLLESLAGVWNLRGDATAAGSCKVEVAPGDVAYLPHDASSLFLTSRVIDDVTLGLTARGVSSLAATEQARRVLHQLGIDRLADRAPSELSSGEAVLSALATLLVTKPKVLLLDEPLSSLSLSSARVVMEILETWRKDSGGLVIMSDHPRSGTHYAGYAEWMITGDGLAKGRYHQAPVPSSRVPYRAVEPDSVLSVSSLSASRGDRAVLRDVTLHIGRGETCVIMGDNGAGKSTLLEALANPEPATVWSGVQDLAALAPQQRVKHVALIPSVPSDLFLTASVSEELVLADRVAGVEKGFTEQTFSSLLPRLWSEDKVLRSPGTHPRDLSRGQQTALAIALQLSHKPDVLLVDEPMRGLDEVARVALSEVLSCVVETGTAIVIATHHFDSTDLAHDRVLTIAQGTIEPASMEVQP